jgi:glycosyltransferase involved in cell wall biosynthesis
MAQLYLLTHGFPYGQGEPFVANELPYLAAAFTHVHILTLGDPDTGMRPIPSNCTVRKLEHRSRWKGLFQGSWVPEAFQALRKHPQCLKVCIISWVSASDIAHQMKSLILETHGDRGETPVVYAYWMSHLAIAAALLAASRKVRVYSRVHGWDLYEERHPHGYLPHRPYLAKQLDAVLPISLDGVERMKAKGFPTILLSRLGVEAPDTLSIVASDAVPTIVSISHIIPLKRLDLIIEVLSRFGKGELRWFHFGEGPERSTLEKAAGRLKIDHAWLGHVPNVEVKQWLFHHADEALLFNASRFEGIPVSMMEAMSLGIPCLGPNVGGVSEIIEHGKNGFLLNPDRVVEEGEQAIRSFINMRVEERIRMRRDARNTWEEKYSANRNYTELTTVLLAN